MDFYSLCTKYSKRLRDFFNFFKDGKHYPIQNKKHVFCGKNIYPWPGSVGTSEFIRGQTSNTNLLFTDPISSDFKFWDAMQASIL